MMTIRHTAPVYLINRETVNHTVEQEQVIEAHECYTATQ